MSHCSLLAAADSHRDWAVALIEDLVRLESPSGDVAALNRCGGALAHHMTALGGRVTPIAAPGAGDHLRAEFGTGESQVLVLGHFDTVWPVGQLERMPVRLEDGRLYGPGSFDMKAGIAQALLAVRAIADTHRRRPHRLVMLWTTDEEIGSTTSRGLIESEARRSRAVLVLEPSLPGGALKTARKGVGEFRVRANGIASHAGVDPTRGASAIHELAWQVTRLTELTDPATGVTVNVGLISGGSRSNVVADLAEAVVDVRIPTMADAARVTSAITQLVPRDSRVQIEVSGGIDRPPLERTSQVAALFDLAAVIAADMGRTLAEGATGGGSDGNFTAALGIPTLDGLGAEGDGAHALHEHVLVESLAFRAALVAGLILNVK
ncbi:MAG: M20 family metallopeptidase [Vicinamibacteria bacterium]|nr:M20 family metallopeptidase [Vicinamibacteria bacterium]